VTPTSADVDHQRWAVDTSTAVPFLDASHSAHERCVDALAGRRAALAGHAVFEAFAVLTRLPGPTRVSPADAVTALRAAFPEQCWMSASHQQALLDSLESSGIVGGMVYDALVGEAARVNDCTLLTRDRRAVATYEFLGVRHVVVT